MTMGMERAGFISADFSSEGLDPGRHPELAVRFKGYHLLEVASSNGKDWYAVTHDGYLVLSCTCLAAMFHGNKCKKHCVRAQAVLNRRNGRMERTPPPSAGEDFGKRTQTNYNDYND